MSNKKSSEPAPTHGSENGRPRVALFQAFWPLQVHTLNVIDVFVERGYAVDLFLFHVAEALAVSPDSDHAISVYDLSVESSGSKFAWRFPKRVMRRLRHAAAAAMGAVGNTLRVGDLTAVFPRRLLQRLERQLSREQYSAFIGVERGGLVLSGEMSRRLGVPAVYFSLELYTNASCGNMGTRFLRLKRLEKRYHALCAATIIQDEPRARILFDDNQVMPHTVHLVPVSLLGPPREEKGHFLHDMLGLSHDLRLILLLGQIDKDRYTHAVVEAAQSFPPDWVLVVHGPAFGNDRVIDEVSVLNTAGRMVLSTGLVEEAMLSDLVASADVGIALYSREPLNDYWTGRASEKVARYVQAGVPVIAFDYPSFRDVFDAYGCGRVVSEVGEMRDELTNIFDNYGSYRAGAFRAYEEVYEFRRQFTPVVDWVDAL